MNKEKLNYLYRREKEREKQEKIARELYIKILKKDFKDWDKKINSYKIK